MPKANPASHSEDLPSDSIEQRTIATAVPDFEPPDARSFLRRHPGAQQLLEDLRGQVASGIAIAPPERPATAEAPTIGNRFTAEFAVMSRRERQLREMQSLATQRVVDLDTEQLRRILEFMS